MILSCQSLYCFERITGWTGIGKKNEECLNWDSWDFRIFLIREGERRITTDCTDFTDLENSIHEELLNHDS